MATGTKMIQLLCESLNQAHDEVLRLHGCPPEDFSKYDWPEWTAIANSIRDAEELLQKPLSKKSLRLGRVWWDVLPGAGEQGTQGTEVAPGTGGYG